MHPVMYNSLTQKVRQNQNQMNSVKYTLFCVIGTRKDMLGSFDTIFWFYTLFMTYF